MTVMNKNPLKACVEFIRSNKKGHLTGDSPYLQSPEEQTFAITEDRIFRIAPCNEIRKLGFVDGGNMPIINSADFTISFNRVAGALFESSQHIPMSSLPEMIEFYTATVLSPRSDGTLDFITKFFPRESNHQKYLPNKDIVININDPSITKGRRFLINIESFGGIARRFAEWSYGYKMIAHELDSGDIFIRDGSLQTGYTGEIDLATRLYQAALAKNVYVTGLSKTCRLLTQNGDSLITVIDIIANNKYPNEKWYYHPIYRFTKADNQADLYFVKLHEHSSYPFRFDIYIKQSERIDKNEREIILSNLAANSQDLSFPGYPYGLIKADLLSRIATRELDSQKIIVLSEFQNKYYEDYIVPRIRSLDAHDLLNKIRF
jgi:hypothetical protein